jgi:ATP-dependent DNA helicase 2 subunit 1
MTGETLDESQISTYIDVGGCRVPFSAQEKEELMKRGTSGAGIQLLRFVHKSSILPEINWVSSPYFVFADEAKVKGSFALLSALIADMSKKNLVALVRLMRRTAGEVRPSVLLPQMEVIDEQGLQQAPAGFHLIQLPFDDEIRPSPEPVSETAKILGTLDKSLGAACKLVESFLDTEELIKSDPSSSAAPLLDFRRYENPAIQRFYSVLQAVALMEESPDWTAEKDTLRPIPALAQPTGKYEQAVMGFKEAFGLDDSVLAAAEGGKKRLAAAAGVGGGGGRGRAKGSAVTSGAGGGDNGEGGDGEEANGGGGGGKAKKVKAEAGAEMT